jgi:TonB-dependent receptor
MSKIFCFSRLRRRARATVNVLSLFLGVTCPSFAQPNENGVITGHVRNQVTHAPLRGASVTLSGDERYFALTSDDGSFRLNHIPAGTHTLIVNYTGLTAGRTVVTVRANELTNTEIELSSDVYKLEAMNVSSVREGQAAAINEQKMADNVVTVLATDAFGNVADTNVGNLLIKLSGISPERDEAETYQVSIRGIGADLNSVSVDGTLLAGASTRGSSRAFELDKVSTNSIESIEVIKAPTPDMDADAIGGKINLRTKSGFDTKGRRIGYTIGSNIFLQRYHNPSLGQGQGRGVFEFARAEAHPSGSINYSEVLGKQQRVAVTFNASFNRTFSPRTALRLGYADNPPVNGIAKIDDFQTTEDDILLDRLGIGGKIHFKLNASTTLFLNLLYNDFNDEMSQHKFRVGNVKPVGTATETVQDINVRSEYELEGRTRTVETGMVQLGGRTQWRNYDIDYDLSTSTSYGTDRRHIMSLRHNNITFRIDQTGSVYYPTITQIAGNDISDYNKGSLNYLDRQFYQAWDDVTAGKLNVKRTFDTRYPTDIKTGLRYRHQEKTQDRWKPRWKANGPSDLNRWHGNDRMVFPVEGRYQRWSWPDFEAANREIDEHPENFIYDKGREVEQDLKDDFTAGEKIYAVYAMGSLKTGPLTTVAGVRLERTETYGTNAAQNEAYATTDPLRYAEKQSIKGAYNNSFPGLHFRFAATPKLIFRASASTSIGRPSFSKLFPGMRIRDRNDEDGEDDTDIPRIEMNNPDIKPQFSDNFDIVSEYYFSSIGSISLSVFRKEIEGFIFSKDERILANDPRFFDQYGNRFEGWLLRTNRNGGWARVDGLEFNYQQQLTFLPGFLNGFGIYTNGTLLRSRGTYEDNIIHDEIKGFTKRSANIGLSYIKYGYTARLSVNYNGGRLTNYDEDPMELVYDGARTSVDFSIKYALPRTRTSIFVDINNLTNSKRTKYQAYENRQLDTQTYGMRITAGISGEF